MLHSNNVMYTVSTLTCFNSQERVVFIHSTRVLLIIPPSPTRSPILIAHLVQQSVWAIGGVLVINVQRIPTTKIQRCRKFVAIFTEFSGLVCVC